MKIIKGSLLEAAEQYIAHQCNCTSVGVAGLAYHIFHMYPKANVEPINREYGKISVHGKVINMYAQYNPGRATNSKLDNPEVRQKAFMNCLREIYRLKPNSVAFPYGIGCGLAGGSWEDYLEMLLLLDFNSNIDIVVYKLET